MIIYKILLNKVILVLNCIQPSLLLNKYSNNKQKPTQRFCRWNQTLLSFHSVGKHNNNLYFTPEPKISYYNFEKEQ